MTNKVVLTLAGEYLTLEVVKQATANKFHGFLGRLVRLRPSEPGLIPPEQAERIGVSVKLTSGTLIKELEHAWGILEKTSSTTLDGHIFEAHLGLTYARIGLLILADANTTSITSRAGAAYTKAWVGQMWAIDPASQIIRWKVLGNRKNILISSIDRQVFDQLELFSRTHSLRFTSCKPALLTALGEFESQIETSKDSMTGTATLVWTEASITTRRSSVVQLLRYEKGQLQALWRGWLTPPALSDGTDDALVGAIRRFSAHHQELPGDFHRQQHWPLAIPDPHSIFTLAT